MESIFNYLSQQSTWKGLIGLATAAGLTISPELAVQIIALGTALVGAINVFRNEKKSVVKTVEAAGVKVPNPDLK